MIRENVQEGIVKDFITKDYVLKFGHPLCVPQVVELKDEIMKEALHSLYSTSDSTKMHEDLRYSFWRDGMKTDITDLCKSV